MCPRLSKVTRRAPTWLIRVCAASSEVGVGAAESSGAAAYFTKRGEIAIALLVNGRLAHTITVEHQVVRLIMQFRQPHSSLRSLTVRGQGLGGALLVIVCLFSWAALALSRHALPPSVARAAQGTIPTPPAQLADRFGVYNWNVDDTAFPNDGSIDRLNWAAERVAQAGTRTIRVALTSQDIYQLGYSRTAELAQIAQHPAFVRLFSDARFRTVLLTVYSRGAQTSNWSDGFSAGEYNTERDEMRRLGEYLLSNPAFAGKTFILFNWEGDNAIAFQANKRVAWDDYVSWIQARTEGVKLARQSRPDSQASLFSGLEYNLVRSFAGQPCGTSVIDPVRQNPLTNRCVIDYVAPRVEVDYYSYSGWQTINVKAEEPGTDFKAQLKNDFEFALAQVRRTRPEVTANNFILGEYGFDRTRHNECFAGNAVNELFDILTAPDSFPLSYAIFWQVVDNARSFGVISSRLGLFRTDGGQLRETLMGRAFRTRLAGAPPEVFTNCPRLRRPPAGEPVLTVAGTTDFSLNPDPVLSVFAANATTEAFSPTGNTVYLTQLTRDYVLPRDNPQQWSESPTRINFALPPARRAGFARIHVTDARGIESSAQDISLTCADCPQISGPCGVVETTYRTLQLEPGVTIVLPGQGFALSGNTVIIEQRDARGQTRAWTLSGAAALPRESSTQINVKLPDDLTPNLDTLLYVVTPQGRQSNETLLPIAEPCLLCGPRLSPCQALSNEADGAFLAGTFINITGRFIAFGNRVVVEQHDNQGRLYRYLLAIGSAGWNETADRIRATLPATLFAGRALIYVIDAVGRESRAEEITIAPQPITAVSAANYRGPELAPASIISLFGNAFSGATASAAAAPLPTELAEAHALIKDSAGLEHPAPLFFVSPTQINLQIPAAAAEGAATVTVRSSFGSASTGTLQITKIAPGLFAANADGRGVAAAVVARVRANGTLAFESVTNFDPLRQQFTARSIDVSNAAEQVFLALFGTGLRAHSSLAAVTVTIGGVNTEVLFAGAQEGFIGLDQVNLRLPRSLAGRGEVAVALTVDGKSANAVTINIR